MKNIHLIPTDKPSRLFYDISMDKLVLASTAEVSKWFENKNIYVTSDEEIKEGDWFIRDGSIHKCFRVHKTDIEFLTSIDSVYCGSNTFWSKGFCKKIILTTDQDLIKDGVQAINDEFLEWFVKNPSCEEVEVEKQMLCDYCGQEHCDNLRCKGYKDSAWYEIIIPKEEPKTNLEKLPFPELVKEFAEYYKNIPLIEEPKQETIEEAAARHFNKEDLVEGVNIQYVLQCAFIAGAKWQSERMFALVEEYNQMLIDPNVHEDHKEKSFKEWFEQFKKKQQ